MSDIALIPILVFRDVGQEVMVVRTGPEVALFARDGSGAQIGRGARNTLTEKEDRQVALTQIRHPWAAVSPPD